MCVKNSMPYLMSSIMSFQKQKYKNKELIVVYSESNDNSLYYLESLNDKNIKFYKYDGPIYKSLNFGIKKSNGEIIGILHSDDVFFNELVLKKISSEYKRKNIDILYGNILYSHKNNLLHVKRIWNNISIDKSFKLPPHTSTFIKKEIYKKNLYNVNYKISSDTEFLLNLKKKKYKFLYINKYITIMRYGGLSTNAYYFLIKAIEDIKIFRKYDLSFLSYLRKILNKTKQIINIKNFKSTKYHKEVNNVAKVKFFDLNKFNNNDGKIISALNLAFLTYNEKYKLRTHKYEFWPDGFFSKILTKKRKLAGRYFIKKIISKLNNNKILKNIYILGNLNKRTKNWINKKLKRKYIHRNIPYGNINKILRAAKNFQINRKSLIIITLPTPKQEMLANKFLRIFPDCSVVCIGGSLNIVSGVEKKAPKLFNDFNLEWVWRLRFDTSRRIKRLSESILILIKIILFRKNNLL